MKRAGAFRARSTEEGGGAVESEELGAVADTSPAGCSDEGAKDMEAVAFGRAKPSEINAVGCTLFRKDMHDAARRMFFEAARLGDGFALINLSDMLCDGDADASRSLLEKALAIAECAPFAARRLAQELLPFRLGTARLLLEEAVAGIDGQQGAEAEVAIELLKEAEDVLASDGPNLTVKCRWVGPSRGELQQRGPVDLVGYRARRGLFEYDYVVFCSDRLDDRGLLRLGFQRARVGSRSWEALDDGDTKMMRRILGTLPNSFIARIEEIRAWISEADPWKPCDIDLEALGVISSPICGIDERVRDLLGCVKPRT